MLSGAQLSLMPKTRQLIETHTQTTCFIGKAIIHQSRLTRLGAGLHAMVDVGFAGRPQLVTRNLLESTGH